MSQVEKNTLRMYLANNNGGLYWPKQNGTIYRGMMFYGNTSVAGGWNRDARAVNPKEKTVW